MKLSSRDAAAYLARPVPPRPGLLIYGSDAMRVALKRQEVVTAMIGPEGEAEMRLTRLSGADARKDTTLVPDGLRAAGFFPGTRVLLVEDAGEGLADALRTALDDWREGDAHLVVTAGQLAPRSSLRKLFEDHSGAYCAAIYDDPPSRAEIETVLKACGIQDVSRDAMADIEMLSRQLDPGDFRQTVEKLALYTLDSPGPVTPDDVAAVTPASTEAELDEVIDIVADSRDRDIGPVLRRLEAQGMTPVGLCIAATRHFRTLYAAASDPEGPARGIARARPPVNFKRRDRVIRQAQSWGARNLETALRMLTDTDLTLRSSAKAPQMAVMERTLIRLAMLGKR